MRLWKRPLYLTGCFEPFFLEFLYMYRGLIRRKKINQISFETFLNFIIFEKKIQMQVTELERNLKIKILFSGESQNVF